MTAPSQLRVFTLHEGVKSSTIFRLEKGKFNNYQTGYLNYEKIVCMDWTGF